MDLKDFLVVIPARELSFRFPGKPLAMINGMPMVKMVYEIVINQVDRPEAIVATDGIKIYDYCIAENINVIMTRVNHMTGTDRLFEVSKKIDSLYYINLQGDEPLFEFNNLLLGIDEVKRFPNTVINFGTKILPDELLNPSIVKVCVDDNNFVESYYRINDYNATTGKTLKHLGVYILQKEKLKAFASLDSSHNEKLVNVEMYRLLDQGVPIKLIEVETRSIGVDHPEDILKVEKILNN